MEGSEIVQPGGTPEGGQPEGEASGQGEGLDPGLFPGIEEVPMEYRQHLDPILKSMESNVNKKLADSAEFRNQWEPYSETGIADLDPETVSDLVGLVDVFSNPEQFRDWWNTVGQEMGFAEAMQDAGDSDDDEFDGDFEDEPNEQQLAQMFDQMLEEKLAPLAQRFQEQEEQQQLSAADQMIQGQLEQLKEKHGEFDEAAVCKLALSYDGEDALEKGFADYQNIINSAQNGLFESKSNQPQRPEGPGPADTNGEKVTDFKSAGEIARRRIQEMQSN